MQIKRQIKNLFIDRQSPLPIKEWAFSIMPEGMERGRRRLFWLLKKWSSYTVWEHHANAFDVFVKAYEDAVANWPAGEAPPEFNLHFAYEAQELYAQGLALLKQGNRTVWRDWEDGYLSKAESASFRAMESITSKESNELFGGERGQPRYDDWTPRLEQLRLLKEQASLAGVSLVREPTAMKYYGNDKPPAFCGEYFSEMDAEIDSTDRTTGLLRFGYAPLNCPATPELSNITVKSGERLPCDGIWEPVFSNHPSGKTDALNYFLKGANAPWVRDPERRAMHKEFVLPMTWQLVWEDRRYLDCQVPDESEYLDSDFGQENQEDTHASRTQPSITRVEGNHSCPQAGFWYTPARQDSRRKYERGELMPDYPESSYGATIWYWDTDQTTQ